MKLTRIFWTMGIVIITFGAGRLTAPKRVETMEVERVVYRERETKNRDQSVDEVVKETRQPDGTVVIERHTKKETTTQVERATDATSQKDVSTSIESRPSWRLGVVYEPPVPEHQESTYSVIVEKRLIGEIYVGTAVSSDKTAGLTLSIGF